MSVLKSVLIGTYLCIVQNRLAYHKDYDKSLNRYVPLHSAEQVSLPQRLR